jgi:hypothetical protein
MIKQAHLCFADVSSGEIHEDIWSVLKEGYWKEAVPSNHEGNVILGPLNRSAWLPVLANYLPIEPGQKWIPQSRSVVECNVNAKKGEKYLSDFLDITETFFKRFEGKHIGVQLSGGMDSSLIIGLLKHFGIPYSLVGMSSERYEFRTEKWIQQKLSTDAKSSKLISFEDLFLNSSSWVESNFLVLLRWLLKVKFFRVIKMVIKKTANNPIKTFNSTAVKKNIIILIITVIAAPFINP